MEIISAILEKDWASVEEQIKKVEGLTEWIQLDICDGQFVANTTWDNSQDLFSLKSDAKLEAHLMINEPWLRANEWLSSPVKRIVVQVESFSSPESVKFGEIVFTAKKYGKEVVWGFKKETDWEPYKELMREPQVRVLFLSVEAGRQGQEFDPVVLSKIKTLKEAHPHVKVAVDGGINPAAAAELKEAGADILVIGSGILNAADPKQAIDNLKEIIV